MGITLIAGAVSVLTATSGVAQADPAPGFDFDPVKLQNRMDQCIQRQVDNGFLLMGWLNVSTGETRQWRCSSLKHMLEDEHPSGPHDPFLDVDGFMRCADRVVSYGFPRQGDDGNTRYIIQYHGTSSQGNVIVNDATSDIASIYTVPNNDWHECAFWQPTAAAPGETAPVPSPRQMTYPA